jgi:hypothetical protein
LFSDDIRPIAASSSDPTEHPDHLRGGVHSLCDNFRRPALVALRLIFSAGVGLWLWQPSLPRVPPITQGILAALLLFGPPLFGFFVTGVRKLRQRRMVTVHHINGVTDTREKLYVEPGVWENKVVEGPSPYDSAP